MPKIRLDQAVLSHKLAANRSQAENYIKLGYINVNGQVINKADSLVSANAKLTLSITEQYVSRGAYKLESVMDTLQLSFRGKIVLDVGSSVGGFTDYALRQGASQVIAVDVGTNQLHPSLRTDERVTLFERTDILGVSSLPVVPDIILIDVSFISLRSILPHVRQFCGPQTAILALVKPQFEAESDNLKNNGIIKNEHIRRDILKAFEQWALPNFVIIGKADSGIHGTKGNLERFYFLKCHKPIPKTVMQ
jgi:23S rRNA (cytidine1920-2'-O)/16S rRNA (cytidine1409-2'-O)-methyltransferase